MMSIHSLLLALQSTSWATAIREDGTWFPLIECVHVLAITFVVGTVAMVDLRLLGVSSRGRAVSRLTSELLPWTWGGFVVAVATGSLMFASAALKYFDNIPFRIKFLFLILAGANMALFHLTTERSVKHWDEDPSTPRMAKVAGGLSLVFWFGVIAAGRWIGFSDF
jgi:hypothetical protein